MPRRLQKLSRAKSRTCWLAWCAWAVVGTIFVFEDTLGGSGTFAWILTGPFWLAFAGWPVLWLWLKHASRTRAGWVEMDDDIRLEEEGGAVVCRVVQKEGVRYVEAASFAAAFGRLPQAGAVKLAGGDEDFVPVEAVRPLAQDHGKLRRWLEVLDSIAPVV